MSACPELETRNEKQGPSTSSGRADSQFFPLMVSLSKHDRAMGQAARIINELAVLDSTWALSSPSYAACVARVPRSTPSPWWLIPGSI